MAQERGKQSFYIYIYKSGAQAGKGDKGGVSQVFCYLAKGSKSLEELYICLYGKASRQGRT